MTTQRKSCEVRRLVYTDGAPTCGEMKYGTLGPRMCTQPSTYVVSRTFADQIVYYYPCDRHVENVIDKMLPANEHTIPREGDQ